MGEIPDSMVADVGRVIEERSGLLFPPEKWPELRKGLAAAAGALRLPGGRALAERLLRSSISGEWMTVLLDHLTVGETYFLREPEMLDALETHILPGLVRRRREGIRTLRVWSAGCSTGEEPYTLAILLCRAIPDIERWDVSVLATDLNTTSLQKAKEGIYSEWSFRGAPEWVKNGFFRRIGNARYSVTPKVRRLVRFERLNLGSDAYPAPWNGTAGVDLVFCRNVLMYLSPGRIGFVLQGFFDSLLPGGYLVVSANELSVGGFKGFERVEHGKAFCFRKPSGPLPAPLPNAVPKPASPRASVSARRPAQERPHVAHRAPSPAEGPPVAPADDPLAAVRRCADAGRIGEALALCRAALEADSMNPLAHYLHSLLLQENGDTEEAVRELKAALYLEPDCVAAYVALGRILMAAGNRREAQRQFANALSILDRYDAGEIVPESGGTTAGALAAMIRAARQEDDNPGDGGGS